MLEQITQYLPKVVYNRFRKGKPRLFTRKLDRAIEHARSDRRKFEEAEIEPQKPRTSGRALAKAMAELTKKGVTREEFGRMSPMHPIKRAMRERDEQRELEGALYRQWELSWRHLEELAQKRSQSTTKTAIRLAAAKPGTLRRLIRYKWQNYKSQKPKKK